MFTINSDGFDPAEIETLFGFDTVRYLIAGAETAPTTGQKHWQGYLEMTKQVRLPTMKRLHPRAHWESARGTALQNQEYCRKIRAEDPIPNELVLEYGEPGRRGQRSDLRAVAEAVSTGAMKVADVATEFPVVFLQHSRGLPALERIIRAKRQKLWRDVKVHTYWGTTGTGKTRRAVEENPSAFVIRFKKGRPVWWDGYGGEEVIIIDELGVDAIAIEELLPVLDGHKLSVEVKGGHDKAM